MKRKPQTGDSSGKSRTEGHRNRPIRLPITFDDAVEGLLSVPSAKKKPEPEPPAKKKGRGKK